MEIYNNLREIRHDYQGIVGSIPVEVCFVTLEELDWFTKGFKDIAINK